MEPPPTPTNLNPNHRLTKPRYGASAALLAVPCSVRGACLFCSTPGTGSDR